MEKLKVWSQIRFENRKYKETWVYFDQNVTNVVDKPKYGYIVLGCPFLSVLIPMDGLGRWQDRENDNTINPRLLCSTCPTTYGWVGKVEGWREW